MIQFIAWAIRFREEDSSINFLPKYEIICRYYEVESRNYYIVFLTTKSHCNVVTTISHFLTTRSICYRENASRNYEIVKLTTWVEFASIYVNRIGYDIWFVKVPQVVICDYFTNNALLINSTYSFWVSYLPETICVHAKKNCLWTTSGDKPNI